MTGHARTFLMVWLALMVGVLALGVFVATALAEPSYTINYQGKLSDATGLAVANGTYQIVFKLYTAPTGGAAIWTETRSGANEVTVTNGLFSVMLGSVTSIASVNFNQALYLGVTVEADAEMTPRKLIGSVPSAFEARQLGGVASTSFLRSDQADSASGLLTFTGGLISNSSTTIKNLSTTNATTTSLYIGGDRITDFTGTGIAMSGTSLTATLGTDIAAAEIADGDHGFFSYASGVASLDTGGLSSANLSAALTDETGSGAVVFDTNPKISGTNIELTSLTASRALFLGTGKQIQTSAASLSLLSSLTDETGTGRAVFSISPAFSGTPTFAALTATSTLTLSGSAANIALGSNYLSGDGGDEGIYVDGDGDVGVGTTGGSFKLDIEGTTTSGLRITSTQALSTGSGAGIQGVTSGTPSAAGQRLGFYTLGGYQGGIQSNSIGLVGFAEEAWSGGARGSYMTLETTNLGATNRSEKLRITGNGDLGIGTTSPNQAVSIFRSAADSAIEFSSLTGSPYKWTAGIDYSDAGKFKISSSSALGTNDRLIIDGNGNVGIGDTTPNAKFDVDFTSTNATAGTEYGTYLSVADTGVVTSGNDYTIGSEIVTTRSGATGGTHYVYGQDINVTGTFASGAGTMNVTGLSAVATGDTTGTSIATAIYAEASGADTNYSGIFMGGNFGIGDDTPTALLTVGAGDLFTINSSGVISSSNNITPNSILSTGQTDEYCLTYEASGTTFEWQTCGGGGMSIGSAVTSGTTGSVLFVDGGNLAQDNANFFFNNTTNRLGLGSTTPWQTLSVVGKGYFTDGIIVKPGDSSAPAIVSTADLDDGISFANNSIRFTFDNNSAFTMTDQEFGGDFDGAPILSFGFSQAANDPGLYFYNDANTGLFSPAADTLGFTTAGTERLSITSSGNIGIGTTTPNQKLTIQGNLNLSSATGAIFFDDTQYIYASSTNDSLVFGEGAGAAFTTTALNNVAIGYQAMNLATTSDNTVAIGYGALTALRHSTLSVENTAIGYLALTANTYGGRNTAVGFQSLDANTTGSFNSAFGDGAMGLNTTGNENTAIGYQALDANTNGSENIAIGYGALGANNGSFNVAIGNDALDTATSTSNTVAIGWGALTSLRTSGESINNTAIGYTALDSTTYGGHNTGIGYNVLGGNTTGSYNTALGDIAISSNGTGSNNVGIGYRALQNATSSGNTVAIGYRALDVMISSGSSVENTAIGHLALTDNTYGGRNTAVGFQSLDVNTTGSYNTGIGDGTLGANTTGSMNTMLGYAAGLLNVTGNANVAVGYLAGEGTSNNSYSSSTMLGYGTGLSLRTGSNNLFLGSEVGDTVSTGSNNILIGYNIDAISSSASNRLNIGNLLFGTGIDGTGTTLSSGNIGIGTSTPNQKLGIFNNGADAGIEFSSASGSTYKWAMGIDYSDGAKFKISSSSALGTNDRLTIDGSGNFDFSGAAQFGSGNVNLITAAGKITGLSTTYFGTDTSSNFAGILTDETGTGNAVFSASPTFTGAAIFAGATFTTATTTNLVVNGERFTDLTGTGLAISSNALTVSLGNDYVTPNMVKSAGQTDEYCLTYESTATTWEWQSCGGGGMSIGGAVTSGTTGSVLFVDGGNLAQDNANFFFNNTTNRLGLGTTTPNQVLTVEGNINISSTTGAIYFDDLKSLYVSSTTSTVLLGSNAGNSLNGTALGNIFIGHEAGYSATSSDENVFIGSGAGRENTLGGYNTFVGAAAGYNNTTSSDNAFFGFCTGCNNLTGSSNSFFGSQTGLSNTTGSNNSIFGYQAGYYNSTASYNAYYGSFAGGNNTTGNANVALGYFAGGSASASNYASTTLIGYQSGQEITTGNLNQFIGYRSGWKLTTGSNNIAFGYLALSSATSTVNTTAIGHSALSSLITSSASVENTAIGYESLKLNTYGGRNTAVGFQTLDANTTGSYNNAFGTGSLGANNTGSFNDAFGASALASNTSGGLNVAIGRQAINANTTGSNNVGLGYLSLGIATTTSNTVAIGYGALSSLRSSGASVENTAIGYLALTANTYGGRNTAVGFQTLDANTTGSYNSAFGDAALGGNTTGTNNSAFGYQALLANTTGANNVVFGYQAMDVATTSSQTVAIGSGALGAMITAASSVENTAIGYLALTANTNGGRNTAVGFSVLDANTTGSYNSAFGDAALGGNTTGTNNSAFGYQALLANTTGANNVAIGYQAFDVATTTSNTVAIGSGALGAMITAASSVENTAIGYLALTANTNGGRNTAVGFSVLDANTTGSYNSGFGDAALGGNTTGTNNSAFGYRALLANTTGADNVAIGYQAFDSATSSSNTVAIGSGALGALITSVESVENTAIGYQALGANTYGGNNTAVGFQTLDSNTTGLGNNAFGGSVLGGNTTGGFNTALGYLSMALSTSTSNTVAIGFRALTSLRTSGASVENTAIGFQSLMFNTYGGRNTGTGYNVLNANTTGSYNSAFGDQALDGNTTGSNNTAIGYSALGSASFNASNNIAIGYQAGDAITSGANNIIIGYDIDAISATASNRLNIGNLLFGTGLSTTGTTLSTGNIGIGTSTPNQKLGLFASAADAGIEFSSASGSTYKWAMGIDYSDGAKFKISSSSALGTDDRFVIDGNGNVGIGDTTPNAKFDVDFTSTNATAGTEYGTYLSVTDTGVVTSGNDSTIGSEIVTTRSGATGGTHYVYGQDINVTGTFASGAGTMNVYGLSAVATGNTTGTSIATAIYAEASGADTNYSGIFMGGNFGIGTTTPGYKLSVVGSGGANDYTGQFFSALNSTALSLQNTGTGGVTWSVSSVGNVSGRQGNFEIGRPGVSIPFTVTSGGNVGVGTSTPMSKFSVGGLGGGSQYLNYGGTGTGYSNMSGAVLEVSDFFGGNVHGLFSNNSGNFTLQAKNQSNPTFTTANIGGGITGVAFGTTSVSAMFSVGRTTGAQFKVDTSGNTTVEALLTVNKGGTGPVIAADFNSTDTAPSTSEARMTFSQGGAYYQGIGGAYNGGTPYMGFSVNTAASTWAEKMRLTSAGNLGIGTSTPSNPLEVYMGTGIQQPYVAFNKATNEPYMEFQRTSGSGNNYYGARIKSVVGELAFEVAAAAAAPGSQSFAEVMRVTGTNVGIGDTSPDYKLDVETNSASTFAASFLNDGNSTNRWGVRISAGLDDHTASGPSTLMDFRDGDDTSVGSITFSSSVTSYSTASDERLKTNIVDTAVGLDQLMQVQVRDFNWKADADKSTLTSGFIAQELAMIYPQAVTIPNNRNDIWQVDYSKLMPLVIAGVQDQNVTVTEQGTTLGSLGEQLLTTIKSVADLEAAVSSGLSENYRTEDETIEAGELVALDTTSDATIKRASYGDDIFGVISQNAGIILGEGMSSAKPVALTGRVKVKVNDDGGDIEIGDAITISTEKGIGTRATTTTRVIGTALEATNNDTDEIHIYVSPRMHYAWNETAAVASLFTPIENNEEDNLWGRITTLASNFVDGVLSIAGLKVDRLEVKDALCVDDVCLTADDLRDLLNERGGGSNGSQTNTPSEDSAQATPEPEPEVTPEVTPEPEPSPEPEPVVEAEVTPEPVPEPSV